MVVPSCSLGFYRHKYSKWAPRLGPSLNARNVCAVTEGVTILKRPQRPLKKKSHTLRKILKINFTEVFSLRADKKITATTVWQKHGSIQPITSQLTDK